MHILKKSKNEKQFETTKNVVIYNIILIWKDGFVSLKLRNKNSVKLF